MRTSTGGPWHAKVSPTTNALNGISFLGDSDLVVVGEEGTILKLHLAQ